MQSSKYAIHILQLSYGTNLTHVLDPDPRVGARYNGTQSISRSFRGQIPLQPLR